MRVDLHSSFIYILYTLKSLKANKARRSSRTFVLGSVDELHYMSVIDDCCISCVQNVVGMLQRFNLFVPVLSRIGKLGV